MTFSCDLRVLPTQYRVVPLMNGKFVVEKKSVCCFSGHINWNKIDEFDTALEAIEFSQSLRGDK